MNAIENDIYLTVINDDNEYLGYHSRLSCAKASNASANAAAWVAVAAACNRDHVRKFGAEPATMREICNAACKIAEYYADQVREMETAR